MAKTPFWVVFHLAAHEKPVPVKTGTGFPQEASRRKEGVYYYEKILEIISSFQQILCLKNFSFPGDGKIVIRDTIEIG